MCGDVPRLLDNVWRVYERLDRAVLECGAGAALELIEPCVRRGARRCRRQLNRARRRLLVQVVALDEALHDADAHEPIEPERIGGTFPRSPGTAGDSTTRRRGLTRPEAVVACGGGEQLATVLAGLHLALQGCELRDQQVLLMRHRLFCTLCGVLIDLADAGPHVLEGYAGTPGLANALVALLPERLCFQLVRRRRRLRRGVR